MTNLQLLALLCPLALGGLNGCIGPVVEREYDKAAATVKLDAGPIRVSFLRRLRLSIEMIGRDLKPRESTKVILRFGSMDFHTLYIMADGEKFTVQRTGFVEGEAWISLEDFERIGGSTRIALKFDRDEGYTQIQVEDVKIIRRFTHEALFFYERFRLEPPKPRDEEKRGGEEQKP